MRRRRRCRPGWQRRGSSQTTINVSWNASSDNVGVSGYGLYRNNVSTGTTDLDERELQRPDLWHQLHARRRRLRRGRQPFREVEPRREHRRLQRRREREPLGRSERRQLHQAGKRRRLERRPGLRVDPGGSRGLHARRHDRDESRLLRRPDDHHQPGFARLHRDRRKRRHRRQARNQRQLADDPGRLLRPAGSPRAATASHTTSTSSGDRH